MSKEMDYDALKTGPYKRIPDPDLRHQFNEMAEAERKGGNPNALLPRLWRTLKRVFSKQSDITPTNLSTKTPTRHKRTGGGGGTGL